MEKNARINKDLEELKNKHTETNNTITDIKNTLEGINTLSEEEWINELKDKMLEITSEEQNKVKRIKRTEDSLRDLWDNIKCTNIWIIGVPEEEEKKKGYEKIFEEIIVDYFLFHIGEIFNYNLLRNFFIPFLFLFFFWDPYNLNVGAFDIVPEISETVLSSFYSFYFILLFRSYFYHFIFQFTDLFFCFRYSAIDSFWKWKRWVKKLT